MIAEERSKFFTLDLHRLLCRVVKMVSVEKVISDDVMPSLQLNIGVSVGGVEYLCCETRSVSEHSNDGCISKAVCGTNTVLPATRLSATSSTSIRYMITETEGGGIINCTMWLGVA